VVSIFEFKARVDNFLEQEIKLNELNPDFIGLDHQVDTYFNVEKGRLKLREGNIENALIWYERENVSGAKQSNVLLYKHTPDKALKTILEKVHGIKVIVDKTRKIYFIKNVKFHFDEVKGLGKFIEVEAIDMEGDKPLEILKEQCLYYASLFEIRNENYVSSSYSDLLME
jgi:adenylate cyclase class 2